MNTAYIAGVDEAGRGPLAGPVTVAAVILGLDHDLPGLTDSKRLSEKRRDVLEAQIKTQALAWSVIMVSSEEIDQLNILQATMAGMARAVAALEPTPLRVLVDGNQLPDLPMPAQAIVGGDGLEACISAASILAKVARDRHMQILHESFPEYGFDRHKGYPTRAHMQALQRVGPCPEHRRSYAPVAAVLDLQA